MQRLQYKVVKNSSSFKLPSLTATAVSRTSAAKQLSSSMRKITLKQHWKPLFALAVVIAASIAIQSAFADPSFRPPSVPLVTNDPYLSIWSPADHLTDTNTQHWTHHENSLISLIRIDGHSYRLMGDDPASVPALPQTNLQVFPTRSVYDFQNDQIHVTLTFFTAALPHDIDILTRPLSYITWEVSSVDGKTHAVSIYDSASSELTVNNTSETVDWETDHFGPLTALKVGADEPSLLGPPGDDTRINWGYAYLATPTAISKSAIGGDTELTSSFISSGALPTTDDTRQPRAVTDDQPVLAFTFDLGSVGATPVKRHVIVAYDELYSIKFSGTKLRPYWRRNGGTPSTLLQSAETDYPSLVTRGIAFDHAMVADLTAVGGAKYAQIVALSYRECLAANGYAADANKQLLMFTKENTSNGDIATVDVIFPQDPMLIFLSPTLAKASIVPVLDYAMSPRWKFPNAPHDLGTYPIASASGDAGEAMVVEESGNMLIIADAIAQEDGNADFLNPYWAKLTQWAQFLQQYGLDPEDQLCTDDFMGHLAHNSNLSVKAIVALGAYGDICRIKGDTADAKTYHDLAVTDANHWIQTAGDGDHYRLAFDKPGSWSQKYNLVWDKILGLNVFPPTVAQQEIAYYKTKLLPFGLSLDSRTHTTKTDWSIWSATLADNQADFETFIDPIYDYIDQTTVRDPIADSYQTDDIHSGGMHARPVVGGFFIKALSDRALWAKWSKGDLQPGANWAPIPPSPKISYIIPNSETAPATWKYVTTNPGDGWITQTFDDSAWKLGLAPFGTYAPDNTPIGTRWTDTPGEIWLRRTVTLPQADYSNAEFVVFHDEDVQIYVNGVLASQEGGFNSIYEPLDLSTKAQDLLKPGAQITIAVHLVQTYGGQGIDLGLANVIAQ